MIPTHTHSFTKPQEVSPGSQRTNSQAMHPGLRRLTPGHRRKCNKPLSCSIDHKPHLQQVLRGVDRPNNTEASSVSPWMTTGILQTVHPSFPRLPFPPVLSLLSHSLPHSCSSCHSQQAASNGLSMLHSPVGTSGTN